MKKFLLLLLIGILVMCNITYTLAEEVPNFTPDQLLEDLDTLVKTIEETHVNLYFSIGKNNFYKELDSTKEKITEPMNDMEFYKLIAPLVGKLNDGHTAVIYPNDSMPKGNKMFPLVVEIRDSKMHVLKGLEDDLGIPKTSEIISINNIKTADIISSLSKYIPGMRYEFREAILEEEIYRLFWIEYNINDKFNITYRYGNKVYSKIVNGVSREIVDEYIKGTYRSQVYHEYEIIDDICYLDFNLMKEYKSFESLLEKMFEEIKLKNIDKLIIDIRDNTGGSDGLSNLLISYIYDKPFSQVSRVDMKVSKQSNIQYGTINDVVSIPSNFRFTKDIKNRFNGKVCLLTNRRSFSGSSMLASTIKDYNMGIIIGEETGGLGSQYGNVCKLTLPNTKLDFVVSSRYIVRPNDMETKTGVIPDIEYIEDINSRTNNIDTLLEFSKKFIATDYNKHYNPQDSGVGRNVTIIDLTSDSNKDTVSNVVKDYYNKIVTRDYEAVYNHLSDENQKIISIEALKNYLSNNYASNKTGNFKELSITDAYAIKSDDEMQKYYVEGILVFEKVKAQFKLELDGNKKILRESIK